MRICPRCQTEAADDYKFCRQCGEALPSNTMVLPGQTLQVDEPLERAAIGLAKSERSARRSIPLDTLFKDRQRVLIGRVPQADIYLPHPNVSRVHAEFDRVGNGLVLHDMNSINGVFLNGKRIQDPVTITPQDLVGVGPYLFSLEGSNLQILDNSRSLRLQARSLEKYVRDSRGQARKILDGISLVVEPGEFVSLLGPSGSGKSTLMDCLNGRRPANGGVVLANGENFYRHFKSFRQALGYVPQKDIVHTQLNVYRALYYTARLRLPLDTDREELQARIDEVVKLMELGPHQNTLIYNLSGGQIKRVSLGAELIARPSLLYIDEATSGLDAGTEARMMKLFRELADEGKSIICITHNVDNVDLCNLILILMRGKLVFYGPPKDARTFFGVTRISEIYDRLADKEPEHWHKQFRGSDLYQTFIEKRLSASERLQQWQEDRKDNGHESNVFTPLIGEVSESIRQKRLPRLPMTHQFLVLVQRNIELLWRDRGGLRLLMLQAPIVALFILLGFAGRPYDQKILAPRRLDAAEMKALGQVNEAVAKMYAKNRKEIEKVDQHKNVSHILALLKEAEHTNGPVMPDRFIVDPTYTYTLLFVCVLVVIWFGCNNAAKEIVKEDAVYSRERAVNLGFLPYLMSKFVVVGGVSIVQVLLFMLCVYGGLELLHVQFGLAKPHAAYQLPYPALFGIFALLAATGVGLGLLLSASVRTTEKANTLLPYVLIPQIILGGGVLMIKDGVLFWCAAVLSPVYWAFRASRAGETELPADLPFTMDYIDSPWIAVGAMLAQLAVLLVATAWMLWRKDAQKG